jgi:hypothetical protein
MQQYWAEPSVWNRLVATRPKAMPLRAGARCPQIDRIASFVVTTGPLPLPPFPTPPTVSPPPTCNVLSPYYPHAEPLDEAKVPFSSLSAHPRSRHAISFPDRRRSLVIGAPPMPLRLKQLSASKSLCTLSHCRPEPRPRPKLAPAQRC